ncbi:hypothetical protein ACQCSX_22145 (plasmid) [Pseudarthrobacter sp. P1]|uniref:hypothetical protein n=1 Tax=Pseudarthrobacter sp. P1 TaxID=3418418 RepID=UPI003CF6C7E7
MTTTPARQPQGIPVGGQFAATSHAEPEVQLQAVPQLPFKMTDAVLDRDEVRERRERLQEQTDRMDQLSQAHSVRGVAAAILVKFPGATTLRIGENEDGENQYDAVSVTDANGAILAHTDNDDAWVDEEMLQNGPSIQELVWDLNPTDDRWAAGIGTIQGAGTRQRKLVDIDLQSAVNAPLPTIPEENDPYTRSFSEDEQRVLVQTAFEGVAELEDKLNERASDYEGPDLARIQTQLDAVNILLTNTNPRV